MKLIAYFLFAALLLINKTLFAQSKQIKFLIDTAVIIMKNNSVNADKVNWDEVHRTALTKAEGISDEYQLGPVMRYLFQSVNDFHGAFFYKDSTFRWSPNALIIPESIMTELKKGPSIKTSMPADRIGYLRIPSMPVANSEEFYTKAQALNDSLCSLLKNDLKGIILDLRLNGGGAMHPMILGVEQLLPQGVVGSFRTKKKENWLLKNNCFYIDTTVLSKITPSCSINAQKIPVVLLISPVTGSSAECLIISFKGRMKTVLLGSKTAGFVTINNGFPIDDTSFMNLSVGYSADKNGKVYKGPISPDIPFESPDRFYDIINDEKVKAAERWLKQHF